MPKISFLIFLSLLFFCGCRFGRVPEYGEFTTRFKGERTELFCGEKRWDFADFVKAELKSHPEMECADLVKFCCQAACGIDHADSDAAAKFYQEYNAAATDKNAELITVTSPDTARVNLGEWKKSGLPPEWLFRMSIAESSFPDHKEKFQEYLATAALLIPESSVKFSVDDFLKSAAEITRETHKIHIPHSQNYLQKNSSYRVISTRYLHVMPVLEAAAAVIRKNPADKKIIAIDGRSASGKTTLASQLKLILNAQVIHMDDFFLPVNMRTKLRYEQAGGNVHYERFKEEVLPHLRKNTAFSYRIFDCKKNKFHGNRMIWPGDWLIVEGAYCMHPEFGDYSDLKVFCDISPAEQMRRIYDRNGFRAAENFRSRWIPLEENYISTFKIDRNADLIIK